MKHKAIIYTIRIIAALILAWVVFGCKSRQSTIGETITDISKTKESHTKNTEVNRGIADSLSIIIGKIRTARPECDSITQGEIDRVLTQLNRYVKSGDNTYRLTYDLYRKILSINTKIGPTVNSRTVDTVATEKYFLTTKTVAVEAKLTTEQKTNLWIGRGFWLLAFVALGWQLKKRIAP